MRNPFYLGLEHLFNEAERTINAAQSYPPRNVYEEDENTAVIEFAVAGYDPKTQLQVLVEDNYLVVKGGDIVPKKINWDDNYISMHFNETLGNTKIRYPVIRYQGISRKNFTVKMWLGEHAEVESSNYKHGILTIKVTSKLPEKKKPKQIAITSE